MIFAVQLMTLCTQPVIPWHHKSFPSPRFYSKGMATRNKTGQSYSVCFHINNVKICTKTEIVFINFIKISSRWITQSASPSLFVNIVYPLTKTFAKRINISNSVLDCTKHLQTQIETTLFLRNGTMNIYMNRQYSLNPLGKPQIPMLIFNQ